MTDYYYLKLTKNQLLSFIMNILATNPNQGELQLMSKFNSVITILNFLHFPTHLLEWRLVHFVPVHNSWLDLVEQLQHK